MKELQIIEHENQRVLLTSQLAESYGTTNDVVTKNFNRNKERYIEGKHFYLLQGNELKQLKANGQIDILPNANKLYLWTERGAFLHAKSLNTDKAWEVYDSLVEHYFQSREKQKPLSQIEMMRLQLGMIDDHETRISSLENSMTITSSQQHTLRRIANETAVEVLGGKDSYAYEEISKKVFSALWKDYKNYFKIPSYRDTLKNDYQKAINYLKNWRPDMNLAMEIEYKNSQIKLEEEQY